MWKFFDTIIDLQGNAEVNVSVSIFDADNPSTLALIYEDDETTPKTNPLSSDELGFVSAKLPNGKYDILYSNDGRRVNGYVANDPADGSFTDLTVENLTVTGDTTLNTSLTGPLKASSGGITAGDIDLTDEVTGALPVGNLPIATQAEAQAGTSSSKVMTPQRTAQAITALGGGIFTKSYASSQQSISNSALITLAHGMGTPPKLIFVYYVCVTNDATSGYSAGDVIFAMSAGNNASSWQMMYYDATNINIRIGSAWNGAFQRKSDGVQTGVSSVANFKIAVNAFA